jgi:phosphate transport system protein
MMRNRFDEQLELLNQELIKMGALCEEAIGASVKALLDGDKTLAEKALAIDREIDQKERDVETLCMRLLMQQQPVARDLRQISSALKMISDMERIGDQAADITEIAQFIGPDETKDLTNINRMAKETIKMVTDAIDSFVKKDLDLARYVVEYDDVVDDLFDQVKADLVQLIKRHHGDGGACLDLLMAAKYFERIGDHAVNIAEWVEYSITGVQKDVID